MAEQTMKRADGRMPGELRSISIAAGVNPYAEGSAEVSFGRTKLLVTATVEPEVPEWLAGRGSGWITAEYGMLPRSTHTRNKREAASGKQGGRTLEIQRLIGRSLRAAVDLKKLGEISIRVDCDVICADGGTRTAAISGGWVALAQAIEWLKKESRIAPDVRLQHIAAVSAGVVSGVPMLDLCYSEDSGADFDLNFVADEQCRIVEVQGTAEKTLLVREQFLSLLDLAAGGISRIIELQRQCAAQV